MFRFSSQILETIHEHMTYLRLLHAYKLPKGDRWKRSWLRHYDTSRKVAGTIPDMISEFLNVSNPFSRITSLASIQPLSEMSTSNLPRV
jgi:hypothetical protein